MENWLSEKSELSNGELLLAGVVLFFAGRLLAAPDTQATQKAFAAGVGVGAGAATAASEIAQQVAQQPAAQQPQSAGGSFYTPPQYGGYPYGPGGFYDR